MYYFYLLIFIFSQTFIPVIYFRHFHPFLPLQFLPYSSSICCLFFNYYWCACASVKMHMHISSQVRIVLLICSILNIQQNECKSQRTRGSLTRLHPWKKSYNQWMLREKEFVSCTDKLPRLSSHKQVVSSKCLHVIKLKYFNRPFKTARLFFLQVFFLEKWGIRKMGWSG